MSLLSSPTAMNLVGTVRNYLNQPNANNSFWSDQEILSYLNEGVRMYFSEVVQNKEGLFATQVDLDITANTDTVSLPTDCYSIRALYKKVTNAYEMLPYRNNLTESYSTQGGTSSNSYLPYYYLRQNTLVLRPTPNFSEVGGLRLEYVQFPDTMVNGGDVLTSQVSPIFKQLIEMYAVYKAKAKESLVNGVSVDQAAATQLGMLAESFKQAIGQRSQNPTYLIPFNPEGDF